MSEEHSVTMWLRQIESGDASDAQRQLWNRYFGQLVQMAHFKLRHAPRRVADEEDVALSALESFFAGAAEGKFARLTDRHSLWPLLVRITSCKASNQRRGFQAQKRGGGRVRGESLWRADPQWSANPGIAQVADAAPSPALVAQLAEECDRLLGLLDEEQVEIAKLKLEGLTTNEIASRTGCSPRTVERRLSSIRSHWSNELSGEP